MLEDLIRARGLIFPEQNAWYAMSRSFNTWLNVEVEWASCRHQVLTSGNEDKPGCTSVQLLRKGFSFHKINNICDFCILMTLDSMKRSNREIQWHFVETGKLGNLAQEAK